MVTFVDDDRGIVRDRLAAETLIQQEQVVVDGQQRRAASALLGPQGKAGERVAASRAQAIGGIGADLAPPGWHFWQLVLVAGDRASHPRGELLKPFRGGLLDETLPAHAPLQQTQVARHALKQGGLRAAYHPLHGRDVLGEQLLLQGDGCSGVHRAPVPLQQVQSERHERCETLAPAGRGFHQQGPPALDGRGDGDRHLNLSGPGLEARHSPRQRTAGGEGGADAIGQVHCATTEIPSGHGRCPTAKPICSGCRTRSSGPWAALQTCSAAPQGCRGSSR
jgi:hypothetical protein